MTESTQRRDERVEVSWIAVIRFSDGSELACTVKDMSVTGMKLSVPEDEMLPDSFMLKLIGRDLVFQVRRAWRRGHNVGVSIERIAKLPMMQIAKDVKPVVKTEQHIRIGSRGQFRSLS